VVHDGIDTQAITPNPLITISLRKANGEDLKLSKEDEVITFVNRNLEPYRGYHIFMRSLPEILKRRPKVRVLIIGSDDISYGARPTIAANGGTKWKDIFVNEVRPQISDADWERVHFLGNVPYQQFIALIQLSTVHVYLTYPFVLSWSLLEAMSAGCAIVASDTQPLHEAINHNETGRLINFFDQSSLVQEICDLLEKPNERQRLGSNARRFAQEHYDIKNICLPAQINWVQNLIKV
jgi:glycosyltransferase involved in cell wall biosynthesis